MIPLLLAALVGGATFIVLQGMGLSNGTLALAGAILAAVLFEAIRDTLQDRHDRLVARLRWYQLRDNDEERTELRNEAALRRILRG